MNSNRFAYLTRTDNPTVPGIGPGSALTLERSLLASAEPLQAIARAYRKLTHAPENVLVAAAYAALKSELWRQFQALPYVVRFSSVDPYANSREMFASLDCGCLAVFTGGSLPLSHPFAELAPNGERYNSIFRAVHDAIAHYPERNSFSVKGELAAFKAHARLLSPLATLAVATETLGQTAYYAVHNRYAPQTAALLPVDLIARYL